jgi:biofilm PGA synthesis N-glycosyltransferase PgaC
MRIRSPVIPSPAVSVIVEVTEGARPIFRVRRRPHQSVGAPIASRARVYGALRSARIWWQRGSRGGPDPFIATVEPRVLIISPVRNEAAHIELVARAVAAQELPPADWIVVDDNSDDDTLTILRRLERELPFLTVLEAGPQPARPVRDRLAVAAAPRTFNKGLATRDWRTYSHIMKLDGDIELRPGYLRELMDRFAADPALGLAGGVLDEPTPTGGVRRIAIPDRHVHGALKCYSRACFEAIGGVQERLGWDTIDETYARMRGFTTRTFRDLVSVHHRPIGSADGTLRGHARHGECAYITHYTTGWVGLRSIKVATRRPQLLSGVAFFYGFTRAAARRIERVPDPEYRRFTRRELRRRMFGPLLPNHEGGT